MCYVHDKCGQIVKDCHEGFGHVCNKSKENEVQANLTEDVIIAVV